MSRKQNLEHPCDVTEQKAVNVISLAEAIFVGDAHEKGIIWWRRN